MSSTNWMNFKVLSLVGVVFLSGCQNNLVRNPFAGLREPGLGALPEVTISEAPNVNVMWSQNLNKQKGLSRLRSFVDGKIIYVADNIGRLKALDKTTGAEIWQQNTNYKFSAGPSIVNDKLILGTQDAQIMVFNRDDGSLEWQQTLSSAMLAPAAGAKNIVVVKTIDGAIQALDMRDGTSLWNLDQSLPALTLRYHSSPKVVGETVIVGLPSGKCLALNLYTGFTQWERTISVPRGRSELQRMVDISADPIVQDNIVYVVAYQGKLAALNVETGAIIWEKEISSFQDLALDSKALYLTDSQYNLWAIEKSSGLTLWKQDKLQKRNVTGPAVVGNKLAVADKEGYLHWIDKTKGKLLGFSKIDKKVRMSPLSVDDQLLIRSQKGRLASINVEGNI
jgi:outer membrane protein assembly factor BamB